MPSNCITASRIVFSAVSDPRMLPDLNVTLQTPSLDDAPLLLWQEHGRLPSALADETR